jgi:ubiquinone/menaquinone biosynthesis C-methylase UbiE
VRIRKEICGYYASGIESVRLEMDVFQLERVRTQEIILRYLPQKPLRILDVGGGSGYYSFWLTGLGHEVHLVDPVQMNVRKARERESLSGFKLASITVGEARSLRFENEFFDLLLSFGPLYHLTDRNERIEALREANRVLKKDGLMMCAAISRYASLYDGFFKKMNDDPEFRKIMKGDLKDGQHRNTTGKIIHFTTAFFHHPDELREEIREAGFQLDKILPVESFGGLLPNFYELWEDPGYRKLLLDSIRQIEDDPVLLGMTSHLLAVAEK